MSILEAGHGLCWVRISDLYRMKAKDEPFVGKTHSLPSSQASRKHQ
jgi:hypothetical protein